VLLVVAHWLRARIRLLQKNFQKIQENEKSLSQFGPGFRLRLRERSQ